MTGLFYLLHIVGDVDPDLHGPYPTERIRDNTARRLKRRCGDEDGLFRLDIDSAGHPSVEPYAVRELSEVAA
jgi:hypothetical protein